MNELNLDLKFFKDHKFFNKKCIKCGASYWTVDINKNTCGEFPCDDYLFIDHPLTKKEYEFFEMLDLLYKFFTERGHKIVERYPVVARWRKDVLLVNASIYDFQPHVTSGETPPPANPLIVAQPCVRMVDIDEVGETGRHLTGFIMVGPTAFNYQDHEVYWKDETTRLAFEFLTTELGLDPALISFKEKPWIGGGNGGMAFEVIVAGLELATLVFMDLKESKDGTIELENLKFERMKMRIVDTGYGLERFVWFSKGSSSIFDAVYPEILKKLFSALNLNMDSIYHKTVEEYIRGRNKDSIVSHIHSTHKDLEISKIEEILYKIRRVHIITDHTRTIAFMLNDGIVPSNTKAGYLARLLIRKTLKALSDLANPVSLSEIVSWQFDKFSKMLDPAMKDTILDMLSTEEERYKDTLSKGEAVVERLAKRKILQVEDLIELYDSYGLPPEVVSSTLEKFGQSLRVPDNFHTLVAQKHENVVQNERREERKYDLPETEPLYYEDSEIKEFKAKVIYSKDNELVLNKTAFYPEGGGQPSDLGTLKYSGKEMKVTNVQKFGKVIVHTVSEPVPVDIEVSGEIDWDRRSQLMKNHTATHIVLSASRKVLGNHVWQAGAQKDVNETRLDITHYKKISYEEIKKIETEAMKIVMKNIYLSVEWLDRGEAEKLYGFKLYEGGIPAGERIRVVKIGDEDVEGCGGTHVKRTGDIGLIKIIKEERIQDGVSRITFTSGLSALKYIQSEEQFLKDVGTILKVESEQVPGTVSRFFKEWKTQRKKLESLSQLELRLKKLELLNSSIKIGDTKVIIEILDPEINLTDIARELSSENGLFFFLISSKNSNYQFVAGASFEIEPILKEISEQLSGYYKPLKNFYIGGGEMSMKLERIKILIFNRLKEYGTEQRS